MKTPIIIRAGKIIEDNAYHIFCETFEGRNLYLVTEDELGLPRTENQHGALFRWFTLIEKEAENEGITWDMIIRHTHQLKITKEALHGMCKTLQRFLWNTTSTKQLKKQGNIDIIIDHFTALFAKEGLELPPFPHIESGEKDKDGKIKISNY